MLDANMKATIVKIIRITSPSRSNDSNDKPSLAPMNLLYTFFVMMFFDFYDISGKRMSLKLVFVVFRLVLRFSCDCGAFSTTKVLQVDSVWFWQWRDALFRVMC